MFKRLYDLVYDIEKVTILSFELQVCFHALLDLLQSASGFTSGFGRKSASLLHEVTGKRKFLKLQLLRFQ